MKITIGEVTSLETLNRRTIDDLGFDSYFYLSFPDDIRAAYKVFPVRRERTAGGTTYHIIAPDQEAAKGAVESRVNHGELLRLAGGENLTEQDREIELRLYLSSPHFILALDKQVSSLEEADERTAGEGRAERLFMAIMDNAINKKSSDVHIVPLSSAGGLHVRFRVDGVVEDYIRDSAVSIDDYLQLSNYLMNAGKMDMTKRRLPQDGVMSYRHERKAYELRIATMPLEMFAQRDDLNKLQLRILYQNDRLTLTDLGMTETELSVVRDMMRQPHGIIICTGPTSSGKSTTMYAMLHSLDLERQICYTVEDPVEYKLEGANQISVNEGAGRTFQGILKSLMRLDTDIVYVGEVRDGESALMACQIANTGHTVFTTLHTNNSYSAPLRLVSMGIPDYLVTSNIQGVIAQRLIKQNCPHCLEEYSPGKDTLKVLDLPEDGIYKRGKGCELCGGKGYMGRTAVFELLPTHAIPAWTKYADNPDKLKQAAKKAGYPDLLDSCRTRINGFTTCPDYVMEVVSRTEALA